MTTKNNNNNKDKEGKLLDHDFDGIKEYDNPMPLWFQFIFYGTIIFAAIYMIYYHIIQDGHAIKNEYNASMGKKPEGTGNKGSFDFAANLKNSDMIESGKQLYMTNCASCHGDKGQGTVGPNLTDDYWISGDTYQDMQKAIEEGVPAKGMPGWKAILGEKKINSLVIYIGSLQGTNPPNAKKPEGKPGKLH